MRVKINIAIYDACDRQNKSRANTTTTILIFVYFLWKQCGSVCMCVWQILSKTLYYRNTRDGEWTKSILAVKRFIENRKYKKKKKWHTSFILTPSAHIPTNKTHRDITSEFITGAWAPWQKRNKEQQKNTKKKKGNTQHKQNLFSYWKAWEVNIDHDKGKKDVKDAE